MLPSLGPFQQEHKKRQVTGRRRDIDRADDAELPSAVSFNKSGHHSHSTALSDLSVLLYQLGTNDIQKDSNNTADKVIQVKELLDNREEEGVSMFDFAFDATSFGNTVENLFYISFLVRDGQCAMIMPGEDPEDDTSVLMLMGCGAPPEEDYHEGLARRQMIMELDPPTWRARCVLSYTCCGALADGDFFLLVAIIEQYIQSCIIPHRERQARVLQKGKWYT